MTVLFIPQAKARIDDALFWLKGYAAAVPDQGQAADAMRMAEGLRDVNDWLYRLQQGRIVFLTEHAIVMDLMHVERVGEIVDRDGKIAKGETKAALASCVASIRERAKRHSDVSRQIGMFQLHQHLPWALPGDEADTVPF